MSNTTLAYYNENAKRFAEGTVGVDFKATQDRFLDSLEGVSGSSKAGKIILDFGCGAGRDTKYFLEQGCNVIATDGSEELCRIASEYTGINVKQMLFSELRDIEMYDGIWACSSILHLPKDELKSVLIKMLAALKPGGIIYTSFKYGEFEGERNGRYFTDFTEESFAEFTDDIEGMEIEEFWMSGDVRKGREEEKWLNMLMKKTSF